MREPVGPPLVSIIVPTRDRPELLEKALQSIAQQTLSDWEAIVVDDGSSPAVDATQLQRRFGSRVKVLQHAKSRGGATAKNTGIDAAKGRLLAFLDDDDLFAPNYLARAVEVLRRNRDLAGIFMNVRRFGALQEDDLDIHRAMEGVLARAQGNCREPDVLDFGSALFPALLDSVPMAFQRVVVRRQAFEAIGRYEPHCLLWDCDWAVRAAATQHFALVLEPLYLQRVQGQGTSSRPSRKLDHMLSRAEIDERLYRHARRYGLRARQRRAARRAAAAAWFDIAYFYCTEAHAPGLALRAWSRSQAQSLSLARLKLLGRIGHAGLSAIGLSKRMTWSLRSRA